MKYFIKSSYSNIMELFHEYKHPITESKSWQSNYQGMEI